MTAHTKGVRQMKPIKTNLFAIVFPFAVGALLILLCGCAQITYSNGPVKIDSTRAFWKTESYIVEISTNGTARMEVNKSGVDTEALNTAITGVVNAVTAVK